MKRCHGRLHYDRKFQIFIFLIGYINVNKGAFCLIISYLRIKSYNVLNYNNCSTDWSFPSMTTLTQKTWGQFSRSEFSNHIKQCSLLPFALYGVHFVLLVCVFIYTYCCSTLMSCKVNLLTFKSNIFVI
jgi:hypothetical protein